MSKRYKKLWGIFVLAMEVITLKVQLFVEIQVGECSKSSPTYST